MDSYDSYDSHGFLWLAMDSYGFLARLPLVLTPMAPRYSHGSRNLLAWVPFVLLSSFSYLVLLLPMYSHAQDDR